METQEDPALAQMRAHVAGNQPLPDDEAFVSRPLHRGGPVEDDAAVFPQQEDYFGFSHEEKVMFPDGVTYVIIKKLNEGDRKAFLNKSNRRLSIKKSTGDAELNVAAGDEKHHLLTVSITGWNLLRGGQPVSWNRKVLDEWLTVANPKIVDHIEAAIHKLNPWLDNEVSIEALEKEIADLTEVLERRRAEEEGKDTSEK